MKVKTITCHDVYNAGASLQAYALQHYLETCGHQVEIIDYKPGYLSSHYSFTAISTPRYDKPVLRELYILSHFPGRLKNLLEGKKKKFDNFTRDFLRLTEKRYSNSDELRADLPDADCFVAGSDQIWNPVLPNGKDPSFFLVFAPKDVRKISYSASFATEDMSDDSKKRMRPWIERLDAVSVRESSGVEILRSMGVSGVATCDPVFLINAEEWKSMAVERLYDNPYVLIYDFDRNLKIEEKALRIAEEKNADIVSVFRAHNKTIKTVHSVGPREFLSLVLYADAIVSNSFHAVAFSLIFHKEFYVKKRVESLNARLTDLLADVDLLGRMFDDNDAPEVKKIEWNAVNEKLKSKISFSEKYLMNAIAGTKIDA